MEGRKALWKDMDRQEECAEADHQQDVQRAQVPGPTPGSHQAHEVMQAGGRVIGKLPSGKGPDQQLT